MLQRFFNVPTGLFLIIATVSAPSFVFAKGKNKADATPQDRIDVLANLPSTGGPITRVSMTQHYSRSYLYLEHESGQLTLVDVTDAKHPSLIANMDLPAGQSSSILTAAGDAALVSSDAGSAPTAKAKTMSIVNFSDPAHPQTVKQFTNVTCTVLDNSRGLIFLANSDGLWILRRNPAQDPQLQDDYGRYVLYAH